MALLWDIVTLLGFYEISNGLNGSNDFKLDRSPSVSIASFGMLGGSLAAGPLANLVGRKWASIFGTCGSLALGYALIPFAQYLWMLLLAR